MNSRIKNVFGRDAVKTPESISETTKRLSVADGSMPTVGVCSSNSLATRRGTRNLIYILLLFFLIFLQLLLTLLLLYFSYSSLLTSSSIVAVLIAKAGHVWVS